MPSNLCSCDSDRCRHTDTPDPVIGLPEQASAMLPADLLQGDEVIILLLKPSPLYIILSCLGTLAVITLVTIAMLWVHTRFGIGDFESRSVMLLGMILLALRISWQFMEWMSRTYVLTDRRIIRIKGVLRVEVFQCEFKRLQHTEVVLSIRERLFGLGTISFSTAGTGFPEAYWLMLRSPYAAHQRILQAINRYR